MAKKISDIVTIYCYNKKEVTTRQKALKFYKQAMLCCEGSERERYTNIFMDLTEGKTICKDL